MFHYKFKCLVLLTQRRNKIKARCKSRGLEGIEFVHDGHDRILLDRASDGTSAWKGGFLIGHELLVGKVRFTTHLGPYFYNPARTTDAIYQRYGLFYRFGRHLLVESTLKAHRHVAEVFELRVGWIW